MRRTTQNLNAKGKGQLTAVARTDLASRYFSRSCFGSMGTPRSKIETSLSYFSSNFLQVFRYIDHVFSDYNFFSWSHQQQHQQNKNRIKTGSTGWALSPTASTNGHSLAHFPRQLRHLRGVNVLQSSLAFKSRFSGKKNWWGRIVLVASGRGKRRIKREYCLERAKRRENRK